MWNELEIRAEGLDIQSWLNGEGILNDSIHRSYHVGENGIIALQLHVGDELKMYYKDIFIESYSNIY